DRQPSGLRRSCANDSLQAARKVLLGAERNDIARLRRDLEDALDAPDATASVEEDLVDLSIDRLSHLGPQLPAQVDARILEGLAAERDQDHQLLRRSLGRADRRIADGCSLGLADEISDRLIAKLRPSDLAANNRLAR